jgi:glycosyltransferase involved in cell wall biosynthesis
VAGAGEEQSLSVPRPQVTFVCKSLPQYRVPFFERLRGALEESGVRLEVIYGQAESDEQRIVRTAHLDWGHQIENRHFRWGPRYLCWQPCLPLLRGASLVIVEQATKLLLNYILLGRQLAGGTPMAFWGHGQDFQAGPGRHPSEGAKRVLSRRPHWWFAYTERSASIVRALPYPGERITVVQNAIDTGDLQRGIAGLRPEAVASFRARSGIRGERVAIFVGGLYGEKRIGFLLEAARRLRARLPEFELVILGAGPEAALVERAAEAEPWIHYPGPVHGSEKLFYYRVSSVTLMPGVVGLGLLDAFAVECPLVTVDLPGHGPEIDYLSDGENGLRLPAGTDPDGYAVAVARLLSDTPRLDHLRAGGRAAAKVYTLDAMVTRFTEGVLRALGPVERSVRPYLRAAT